MRAAVLAVVVSVLMLMSCEPIPDEEPLACRNPEAGILEVGAGDLSTGFIEVHDGGDIEVVLGPQGLHMVVVSARIRGFEALSAGGARSRVTVAVRQDGKVVGGTISEMPPSVGGGSDVEFLGIRAVLTVAEIDDVTGKLADVAVSVRDGCGRDIRSSRSLRLTR